MMPPATIRDTYAAFVRHEVEAGIDDPQGLLEGSLDVPDDIIAGRETRCPPR